MDRHVYRTGEFARKASVTVRTLRYYDKVGLLCPSAHTEAGYRLYTDEDLVRLQQILALKFLGFALDEIRRWLRSGPALLPQALAVQKAMMREKRAQLDIIITAIEETERAVVATWAPYPKAWRMTLTFPVLDAARQVVFAVEGGNKSDALRAIRAGGSGLPAERVAGDHVEWLVDAAAAGEAA